jgi:hypothetical protein
MPQTHRMSAVAAALSSLAVIVSTAPALAAVTDTSSVAPSGERILQQSIVIDAPRAQVWRLFTTSEGLRRWEAPVASIDLRVGGLMQSSYA